LCQHEHYARAFFSLSLLADHRQLQARFLTTRASTHQVLVVEILTAVCPRTVGRLTTHSVALATTIRNAMTASRAPSTRATDPSCSVVTAQTTLHAKTASIAMESNSAT
jgi:hypothetical protein